MKHWKNWRINFILLPLIFLLGAVIISRLFYLQVWNHKFFQARALGQQSGFSEIQGSRGEIFFESSRESKGGEGSGEIKSIAINQDKWTVSGRPKEIENKDVFAKTLAQKTGQTPEDLLAKLNNGESYVVLKKDLSSDDLNGIKALKLAGLYWEDNPARYYPQEELASHVIGFLGGDKTGQYGIEGYYDDILTGKAGIKEQKRGLSAVFSNDTFESLDGSNLYLTIDYNIQFEAEALLKEAGQNLSIESGQIIVLKPDTGKVLAMANYPPFNPNQYSKQNDMAVFQNSAVQKIFEPGSIMKPFTVAIALNEGKITPDTTFTDTGSVKIGPNTIYNFGREKYGTQNISGILEKSINTGAVFVSQHVSHKTYFDYLEKFGFTQKTGIDLQGEVYSANESLKNGHDTEYATSSFGQGVGLTPIQIARGFCAIANGGKLVNPYVVEKIANGADELQPRRKAGEQIISSKTAGEVTQMLINVVSKGFGGGAKIPGYYLAGKTGTAQLPYENKKGYYEDKTIQSFIGFGPALNPQFLILVKLDEPKVPKSSLSAAPIFRKLAQYIINYWQIPPDYTEENKQGL